MLLTVSIGNTNTVIALLDCGSPAVRRISTESIKKACDTENLIESTLVKAGSARKNIGGAILASVVPQLTPKVSDAIQNVAGKKPILVSTSLQSGLDFTAYSGSQPGGDRIAVCAGAWERGRSPLIVIDMGTATTFNVVDRNGSFLGGAILPGLRMGLEALKKDTAQLPRVNIEDPPGPIGHSTEECLLAGACFGTAAMIDGLTSRMAAALGTPSSVWITGGNAGAVIPFCKTELIYEPNLLLEGLAVLYRLNHQNPFLNTAETKQDFIKIQINRNGKGRCST
jgi:type III pantothenate kinase